MLLAVLPALAAPDPIIADVERNGEQWTVTWTTPEPVAGLWFRRNRHNFRGAWKRRPKKLELVEARYGEILLADKPRTTFEIGFDTDTTSRTKDYNLNLGFSDGSVLLYTQHLAVWPMLTVDDGVQRAPEPWPIHWRFKGDGDKRAWDQHGGDVLELADSRLADHGTYVYFGSIEPIATDAVTAIIDPGLPDWLGEATTTRLPQLFEQFGTWTGHTLDFKPLILASTDHGDGMGLKGGTLPGVMQLAAFGSGWADQTPDAEKRWFWFLAHESFHFWNSQMFPRREARWEEWISEGLSNLYADRALLELGVIDQDGYRAQLAEREASCVEKWDDGPLLEGERLYGAWYDCGELILARLDHQLKANDDSLDRVLHDTWVRSKDEGAWSTHTVLEVVQERHGPSSVGWITDALWAGPRQPVPELVESWMAELDGAP